jgi:putative tricarboxylic transport membrane protein
MQLSKERIGALFFLVLSMAYGYYGSEIRLYPGDELEPMNAQTLPYVLSIMGIGLSVFLLLAGKDTRPQTVKQSKEWLPVVLLLVLTLIYGLTLDWLGFLISTTLFLIGGFWVLGERRWSVLLKVAVPFVLLFWGLLTQVLDIYLAPGRLFAGLF